MTTRSVKEQFRRSMSTVELVAWLAEKGIPEKERQALSEEGFTGESFLLLDSNNIKELGFKMAERLRLLELIKEASVSTQESNDLSTGSEVPVVTPSTVITNQLTDSSTTVSQGTHTGPDQGECRPFSVVRFDRELSTIDLVEWLQSRGLSSEDATVVQAEGFTGESFLVMNSGVMSTLHLTVSGQSLINSLRAEAINVSFSNLGSGDVAREEEVPVYCSQGFESATDEFGFDEIEYVCRSKVWKGRELLKVAFLNPEVLSQWGLTIDAVLSWANLWDAGRNEVPEFAQARHPKRADIRVMCSDTEGCSCMIGMEAEMVRSLKPTMVLSLRGQSPDLQKSLVMHQFGHALGLDHEHQRSDFWDVVGQYFEQGQIPRTQTSRVLKKKVEFDRMLIDNYDPQSIMHYWFDPDWLKNPGHRDRVNIEADNTLTATEKRYLLGVLTRQGDKVLPKNPSPKDLECLASMYGTADGSDLRKYPQRSNIESKLKTGTVLELNVHKQKILNAIWDARDRWRVIGECLGLSKEELDVIGVDSRGECGSSLDSVLTLWITKGNKHIRELQDVLCLPIIAREDLAQIIRTVI